MRNKRFFASNHLFQEITRTTILYKIELKIWNFIISQQFQNFPQGYLRKIKLKVQTEIATGYGAKIENSLKIDAWQDGMQQKDS